MCNASGWPKSTANLYGLNGYYLKFAEALQGLNNKTTTTPPKTPGSHQGRLPAGGTGSIKSKSSNTQRSVPTFEALFRPQPTKEGGSSLSRTPLESPVTWNQVTGLFCVAERVQVE